MTFPHHLRRLSGGVTRCTSTVKRAVTLVALLLAAALAAGLPAASASATPLPRISLKVLLLGTSSTQSDLVDWQAALQREGVRFTTVLTSTAGRPSITTATLSSTLADGTPVANYDAVIVANGGLVACTTSCVSGLSQAEWTALEQYEKQFNIRQISGDVNPGQLPSPGPVYGTGMNLPTLTGTLDGVSGTLTADGQKVFPYLNASAPITIGTVGSSTGSTSFGYEATPSATASFDTLVSGPNGTALVGIYTHPNGVQELVETYAQNEFLLQDQLLRHGVIAWVTRGVYFGDQRNYVETNIDDTFIPDDVWDTTTHANDYDATAAVRETASDVDYAASWSHANSFRIDNLFNGSGGTAADPLLAEFKRNDPATGKPYAQSFGWINHTWDHPNLDNGCASPTFIQTEISENNTWASSTLGLTSSTDPTAALGNNNPGIVVTGEHSGLANLVPGNPGTVDPPAFDAATPSSTGGTLAAGSYTYAITDQFSATGGESSASTTTVTVPTGATAGSVALSWEAVCHAADYKIYREVTGSNVWTLVTTKTASSADFTNTGPSTLSLTDTGAGQVVTGWTPPTNNAATETAYQQNTNLVSAFKTLGITGFGADASKPYPNPANTSSGFSSTGYTGTTYPAGASFTEPGITATAIPRYPTNIFYNVATQAEEVDEYNQIYLAPPSGNCDSTKTTCLSAASTFTDIVNSVVNGGGGIFQHMVGNDPRPDYFHQSNMIGGASALYYSVMNQLLAQYRQYFNATTTPITQPTMAQIASLLTEQAKWSADQAAAAPTVSGYIQGNQVTITNTGSAVSAMPITGVTTVGSTYGGTQSGWTTAPATGTSVTYTAQITWPVDTLAVSLSPTTIAANGVATSTATATLTADGKPVAGEPVTFASSDSGEKISAVTDNKNGTYTATITSSTTIGTPTITATDTSVTPTASGQATLTQAAGPAASVAVSLVPTAIPANGTAQATATAHVSDTQGHAVAGDHVGFASNDPGEKISAVTDNKDGTYTATITSSTTIGTPTITATDTSVTPAVSGQASLSQGVGPVAAVAVSLSPAAVPANGTAQATATAHVSDTQGHAVAGDHVGFASNDPGEKISAVTDNKDGTYTATITSSTTIGTATVTATDSSVTPAVSGQAILTQMQVGAPLSAPVNVRPPSISGTPTVGRTLTATPGTWSGTAPIGYAYQWQRCGVACRAIAGATTSTYRVASSDRGARLRVLLTATNAKGSAQAASSQVGPAARASAINLAQARKLLSTLLAPTGAAARIGTLLKAGGYSRVVAMPAASHLQISWYQTGRRSRVLLARVETAVATPHRVRVTIILTRTGRRSLAGAGNRVSITAHGTLTVAGLPTLARTRSFAISR